MFNCCVMRDNWWKLYKTMVNNSIVTGWNQWPVGPVKYKNWWPELARHPQNTCRASGPALLSTPAYSLKRLNWNSAACLSKNNRLLCEFLMISVISMTLSLAQARCLLHDSDIVSNGKTENCETAPISLAVLLCWLAHVHHINFRLTFKHIYSFLM